MPAHRGGTYTAPVGEMLKEEPWRLAFPAFSTPPNAAGATHNRSPDHGAPGEPVVGSLGRDHARSPDVPIWPFPYSFCAPSLVFS
jgi:hypothetical protein